MKAIQRFDTWLRQPSLLKLPRVVWVLSLELIILAGVIQLIRMIP